MPQPSCALMPRPDRRRHRCRSDSCAEPKERVYCSGRLLLLRGVARVCLAQCRIQKRHPAHRLEAPSSPPWECALPCEARAVCKVKAGGVCTCSEAPPPSPVAHCPAPTPWSLWVCSQSELALTCTPTSVQPQHCLVPPAGREDLRGWQLGPKDTGHFQSKGIDCSCSTAHQ